MDEVKKLTVKNIPVTIKQNAPPVSKEEHKKEPVKSPAVKKEEVQHLSAKLNPEYDKDLMEALMKVPKRERSKLYRDAVRQYLGLHSNQ